MQRMLFPVYLKIRKKLGVKYYIIDREILAVVVARAI